MNESNPVVATMLSDRILTITLNRPEARNAINTELNIALHEAVSEAAQDDEVGCVVVRGAGDHFCAGGDVRQMASADKPPPELDLKNLLGNGSHAAWLLHTMPKPTISMIRGSAAGGGLAIALACDLRYASPTSKIAYAYSRLALPGDFGVNYFIQKRIGPSKALEFAFMGEPANAQTAHDMGLFTKIVPDDELDDTVMSLARALATGPTSALAAIKANLLAAQSLDYQSYANQEADNFIAARATANHMEAARAFLEKRPPRFDN